MDLDRIIVAQERHVVQCNKLVSLTIRNKGRVSSRRIATACKALQASQFDGRNLLASDAIRVCSLRDFGSRVFLSELQQRCMICLFVDNGKRYNIAKAWLLQELNIVPIQNNFSLDPDIEKRLVKAYLRLTPSEDDRFRAWERTHPKGRSRSRCE